MPPNEKRLSCAAVLCSSQTQFYYDGRRQLQPLVRQLLRFNHRTIGPVRIKRPTKAANPITTMPVRKARNDTVKRNTWPADPSLAARVACHARHAYHAHTTPKPPLMNGKRGIRKSAEGPASAWLNRIRLSRALRIARPTATSGVGR
jgi:hypothetical protein